MDIELGQRQAEFVAKALVDELNKFHKYPQPYDDDLDAQMHLLSYNKLTKKQYFDWSLPRFAPSSANACDLELYMKIKKAKQDEEALPVHQRRWTAIGTGVGGVIQREILLYERHIKKFSGDNPVFKFERTNAGEPMFEEFAKRMHMFDYKGKKFSLFGTCDGIMQYTTPSGKTVRVGLEIKTKQSSYQQTSHTMMKEAKEDHVKQCVAYSMMYNVDYYVILYVNTAHKSWEMDEESAEKYPDIRAFGLYITDDMRCEVLDKFVGVLKHVELNIPPDLDLSKFTFNKYKKACADVVTDDEFAVLTDIANKVKYSNLPVWKKNQYVKAYNKLAELKTRAG